AGINKYLKNHSEAAINTNRFPKPVKAFGPPTKPRMVNSKATANRPKPRFSKAVLLLFFQPIKHITKEVIKVIGPKIWKIICVFKSPEIINKTPNANK